MWIPSFFTTLSSSLLATRCGFKFQHLEYLSISVMCDSSILTCFFSSSRESSSWETFPFTSLICLQIAISPLRLRHWFEQCYSGPSFQLIWSGVNQLWQGNDNISVSISNYSSTLFLWGDGQRRKVFFIQHRKSWGVLRGRITVGGNDRKKEIWE